MGEGVRVSVGSGGSLGNEASSGSAIRRGDDVRVGDGVRVGDAVRVGDGVRVAVRLDPEALDVLSLSSESLEPFEEAARGVLVAVGV